MCYNLDIWDFLSRPGPFCKNFFLRALSVWLHPPLLLPQWPKKGDAAFPNVLWSHFQPSCPKISHPSWRSQCLLQSCPKFLPLLPLLLAKILFFCSSWGSSLLAVQVALQHGREWSCRNPTAPGVKWAQEREPGILRVQGKPSCWPGSAEPSLNEASGQPEFSQN